MTSLRLVFAYVGAALLFFVASLSHAADVNVKATVDRNSMRPGDSFTYTISISSEDSAGFEKPTLPGLTEFDIINTWSGSEMRGSFVNGQMQTQRSQTFNYMLSAKQEGSFTIGAAEVVINGQVVRTNPIKIEVSPSAPQAPSMAQQPDDESGPPNMQDLEDDIFSQLLRRRVRPNPRGGTIDRVTDKDAFFIHVQTDKKQVYQGEQITVSWYLVTRAQIADIDTLKYPALSGFWKEDIEVATRLNFQPEIINGVHYQKALLASYALFPIKAGPALIDKYQAKCRAIGANSIGFPQEVLLTKESEELKIDVLPLPENGKPPSFAGGVGAYTASASLDSNAVKVNTPITLKIRIEGQGNAKTIDMPKLQLNPDIQVYDTKAQSKYFANGRSFKEFETLIVPKVAGSYSVPAIEIGFFDPVKKSYYVLKTPELPFQVQPGDGSEVIPSAQMKHAEVEVPQKKLSLPDLVLSENDGFLLSSAQQAGAWAMLFLLTVLGLTAYGYKALKHLEVRKDLRKEIAHRIASIEKHMSVGDWRAVGREATNMIYFTLGEISLQGGAAFEFERLVDKAPPSFKRDVAPRLREVMAKVEAVGFAPEEMAKRWREKNEMKKLLKEIEGLLLESAKYDFSQSQRDVK